MQEKIHLFPFQDITSWGSCGKRSVRVDVYIELLPIYISQFLVSDRSLWIIQHEHLFINTVQGAFKYSSQTSKVMSAATQPLLSSYEQEIPFLIYKNHRLPLNTGSQALPSPSSPPGASVIGLFPLGFSIASGAHEPFFLSFLLTTCLFEFLALCLWLCLNPFWCWASSTWY